MQNASEFLQSFHLICAFKVYILSISYLFLAALCLCSGCGLSVTVARAGYSLGVMHSIVIAVASLVAEQRLEDARAQLLRHTELVAPKHVRSSQIGDQTHVFCTGKGILYH